ncbi:MAG: hypothetical protein AB7N80_15315 [Bdellovibrionales bacterium]
MIEKLSQLLRVRFGAQLSYQKLSSHQRELRDQLLRQAPLQQEDQWLFPVFSDYQLVGCAVVTGVTKRLDELSVELSEFVELYLDAAVALTDQLELLDQIEHQLNRNAVEAGGGGNVIPLRRPLVDPQDPIVTPRLRRRARIGFALPCLLEGPSQDDLKRLALELHELSGRYAFVYLSDLNWNKASDLKGLGPVTLYVPDITTLTLDQQIALTEYLRLHPSVEQAQIVAGTLHPYSDLRQSGALTMDLLHFLSVCYLKMDRPFCEYRREGIIEFFFGSLIRDNHKGRLI